MADTLNERKACPACGGVELSEIYRLDAIPVQSCVLLKTEAEARNFRRAPLVLCFCDACGFIFNKVFVQKFVDYASSTEESQHFSGTFNQFAKDLAAEIASLFRLEGKRTLEIGCGKGEFLKELAEQTGTIGLGVDPGFIPERLTVESGHDIAFQREYFDPATLTTSPDFVVCRHTLEHIPDVKTFMADIARAIGQNESVKLCFETPDVRRVLEDGAFWDIYYEHCSYFTQGSHARLFRAAGMDVTKLYLAYDGQYIIQYATAAPGVTPLENERDLDDVRRLAARFPRRVAEIRAHWLEFVTTKHAAGKFVAIWGGGSKGVSFLTTNGLSEEVSRVIDINPFKQGKFLPGTGHRICAPEELPDSPPDTVIVMNRIYLSEIGARLHELGLEPELVAV